MSLKKFCLNVKAFQFFFFLVIMLYVLKLTFIVCFLKQFFNQINLVCISNISFWIKAFIISILCQYTAPKVILNIRKYNSIRNHNLVNIIITEIVYPELYTEFY